MVRLGSMFDLSQLCYDLSCLSAREETRRKTYSSELADELGITRVFQVFIFVVTKYRWKRNVHGFRRIILRITLNGLKWQSAVFGGLTRSSRIESLIQRGGI